MPCWVSVIFEGYQPTDCPYKQARKYIENNPEIIARYKQWVETNKSNYQQ
jgi:hypothetical protein